LERNERGALIGLFLHDPLRTTPPFSIGDAAHSESLGAAPTKAF
jgi:hypothetical protein